MDIFERNKALEIVSHLYAIHPLIIQNIYNKALFATFNNTNNNNRDVKRIILDKDNNIVIYNFNKKEYKLLRFTHLKYKDFYNKFSQFLHSYSFNSDINDTIKDNEKTRFLKVEYYTNNRKFVYLKQEDLNNRFSENIIFKYKYSNKDELDFIKKREKFLIEKPTLKDIKISHKETKDKNNSIIKCELFSIHYMQKFIELVINKIETSSKNYIQIKRYNINTKQKVIYLNLNIYIPTHFIKYLSDYIKHYTNYTLKLGVNK